MEIKKLDPIYSDSGHFTDSRDQQTYRWIKIGDQFWMAENFRFATPPKIHTSWITQKRWVFFKKKIKRESKHDTSFYYDDKIANKNKLGRLYDWETANKITPEGWRLPSLDDWEQLLKFLQGDKKELYHKLYSGGFNINLSGYKSDAYGNYWDLNYAEMYWSSTIPKHNSNERHNSYDRLNKAYCLKLYKSSDEQIEFQERAFNTLIKHVGSVRLERDYKKHCISVRLISEGPIESQSG